MQNFDNKITQRIYVKGAQYIDLFIMDMDLEKTTGMRCFGDDDDDYVAIKYRGIYNFEKSRD